MARTQRPTVFAGVSFAISLLLPLIFSSARLSADDVTAEWTGDGTGDLWQDADNWSTPVIPNNGNDRFFVAITGDPNNVTVFLENRPPGIISVSTLSVGSGDRLNISGVLRVQTRKTSGDDPSGLVENAGTIELGERARLVVNVNTSDESPGDTVTLTGGGKIILNEPFKSQTSPGTMIHGEAEQPRTLLIEDQVIEGTGRIGNGELRIINKKEIVANRSNAALVVDPGAGSANVTGDYTNDGGVARATAGGILQLTAGTFNNINGGKFVAESNSFVDLAFGTHIHGGLLQSLGTGRLRVTGDSFLNGPANNALTIAAAVDVQDGNELVLQGNITNLNTTTLMAGQRATAVLVDGNVSLAGSGIIRLDTSLPNLRRAQIKHRNPDAVLTIGNGQSVVGTGSIEGELTIKNQGTISANRDGRTLTISPTGGNTLENTRTLQAEEGGRLLLLSSWELHGGNGTGTIQALDKSQVLLDGVTIKDQTFKTPDNPTATDPAVPLDTSRGVVRTRGNGSTLDLRGSKTKNEGLIEIANGTVLTLTGQTAADKNIAPTFENSGTIFLNAATTLGTAGLNVSGGDVRLTGGGRIALSDSARNRIDRFGTSSPSHLINADNTIEGSGQIGLNRLRFTNELGGTVRSKSATGLVIDPAVGAENRGSWEATDGGRFVLQNGGFANRSLGEIRAVGDGSVVRFESAIVVQENVASIRAEEGGVVEFHNADIRQLGGSIEAIGTNSIVDLSGNVRVEYGNAAAVFGSLDGGLIRNRGYAFLDNVALSGNFLAADGSTTQPFGSFRVGKGTARVFVGGDLARTEIVIFDDLDIEDGLEIVLSNSERSLVTGSIEEAVVLKGTIRGAGQITKVGLMSVMGSMIADGRFAWIDGTELQNTGAHLTIDTAFRFVPGIPTDDVLTVFDGGLLGAEDGGTLEVKNSRINNYGEIRIRDGSALIAQQLHNSGTLVVTPTATVTAKRAAFVDGIASIDGKVTITEGDQAVSVGKPARLSGTGTINGKLVSSGAFAPGKSPGSFKINGDFEQLPGGELEIEMAGVSAGTEFDQLVINGQASLDGMLAIKSLDGFVADLGSKFDVVSATSIVDNGFSLALISGGFVQPAVVNLGNGNSALRLTSREAMHFASTSGAWDDRANWNGDAIPTANDIAFLPGKTDSTTTITGPSVDTSILSLVIGSEDEAATGATTFALSSGILTTTRGTTLRHNGRLTGDGTLDGDLYNAGGVGSAESVATFSVTGNYNQTEDGQLVIALGGTEPDTDFSRLEVGGNAALDGKLNIELVALDGNILEPDQGDMFDIVTADRVSGRFSVIDLPTLVADRFWSIDYRDTSVRLEILSALQRGDFDGNGQLDIADIDLLTADLVDGTQEEQFDINEDGRVSPNDLTMWVNDLKGTWIGDANLDGEFNSNDLVMMFTAGQYEDEVPINSTWGTGDFDGNGEFDSGDLVAAFIDGGYEQGPRVVVNAVPEPSGIGMLMIVLAVTTMLSTRRRRRRF